MSESRSHRIPWGELLEQARAADRPLTDEELQLWERGVVDGSANFYAEAYVLAMQEALEQRQPERLLGMLESALPLPPFLLPALAAVLRSEILRDIHGQASVLDAADEQAIREHYGRLITYHGMSGRQAKAELAKSLGVSYSTVERALQAGNSRGE